MLRNVNCVQNILKHPTTATEMCGIAGIINFKNREEMLPLLEQMTELLHHRGPDAKGYYSNGPAGLAHARLSIIDLDTGDQPIANEDKTVWVVFNGEIFNYPELRNDLKLKGHSFSTRTDTEVLVHLYEELGTDMFKELNGQFAFALWDAKKETLLLGRDRVGIRPLFYYLDNQRLIFGSEIKAIFADNRIPRKIDTETLADIFTCWSSFGANTTFENIFQVPPGHYALFTRNGLEIDRYWQLTFNPDNENKNKSVDDWALELNTLLKDAARIRLRADVPVGCYLSGGIDSTYISSLVKNNFNNRLRTFSVAFQEKRFNEAVFQDIATQSLKTDHSTIHCSNQDISRLFPKVIWHTETPLLRTGPVPLFQLSGLVRKNNFKVVLTGEGADEIFAGYNIFKEDKVRRFWAKNPDSALRPKLLERLYPYIFSRNDGRAKTFLKNFFKKSMQETSIPFYSHLPRWQNTFTLKNFFSKDLLAQTGGSESCVENRFYNKFINSLPPEFMSWAPLSRAQYIESTIFMSNYLLSSQGDRMAMGNSVEGRYPFLDHRVIEFAGTIPPKYRMNGLQEKFILKRAAKNLIPDELVNRPKQPYRAPISESFFGKTAPGYVAELLSENAIKEKGYFDHEKVSRLVAKCSRNQGNLLSERENMAIVGILSTHLIDEMYLHKLGLQE
jgi:asparagine synthase (glutamine-hydrolysing)